MKQLPSFEDFNLAEGKKELVTLKIDLNGKDIRMRPFSLEKGTVVEIMPRSGPGPTLGRAGNVQFYIDDDSWDEMFEAVNESLGIKLVPMKGAGMYGDDHPDGTMEANGLNFEQAKTIEKLFNMKTGNAPDGYDVTKIETDKDAHYGGADMSVQSRYNQPNHFIELTKEMDGSWTLTCGPKAVERIKKALGLDTESIWPKIQPDLFKAEDSLRKAMNTLNSIDPNHGSMRSMVEAANALEVVRRYFKQ